MERSISWSSAFENPGLPSQHQSSIPRASDASCAAAAVATASPTDWPAVSAGDVAEFALSLLKTIALAGVK
jgi:hypothetical protein